MSNSENNQASPDHDQEHIHALAATGKTFKEIEQEFGREVAIKVGIARDPDTWELTEEDIARARRALEVEPALVEQSLRRRCQENPSGRDYVTLPLDNDIIRHFLDQAGQEWHIRLNSTLRQAVFGPGSP